MNATVNIEEEMTDAGKTGSEPRQAKGGVFAIADIELIKDTLRFYILNNDNITDKVQRQIANLLHRLNSRA